MHCRPDVRYTALPRPLKHSMQHSSTESAAGWLDRSSMLSNNLAVSHLKLNQNSEDVGYVLVVLQSKSHELPENPCSPKLPALRWDVDWVAFDLQQSKR